ncbi:putative membrane protein [Helicobacter pylori Hp P-74]|uniref:Putative membrane protein n=1 Tax=Helicobacter pylori Hp P-15 TaxID=992080 RepID=I9WK08_HELPX|nr:putative membrane protein [Helicobacter pylori Hp P-15]EJC17713.1 putative membrane protein [Helicobacter pylori Hp P-74]EJC31837.1 putative membrane protein [Helicobacter pylori Hp P-15b]
MRHARYWLFVYAKLLWILADMGSGLICSLCSGFVEKI